MGFERLYCRSCPPKSPRSKRIGVYKVFRISFGDDRRAYVLRCLGCNAQIVINGVEGEL